MAPIFLINIVLGTFGFLDSSSNAMSEHDAHPCTGCLHLRDAVLEAPLRLATGNEKVPSTEFERA